MKVKLIALLSLLSISTWAADPTLVIADITHDSVKHTTTTWVQMDNVTIGNVYTLYKRITADFKHYADEEIITFQAGCTNPRVWFKQNDSTSNKLFWGVYLK